MKHDANNHRVSYVFPTHYDAIVERVHQIDPIKYGYTRNFVDGDVTYLSPYISRGVISVKQVQEVTLARGFSFQQAEKFYQELAWREYFQRVWQAKGDGIFSDIKQAQADVAHREMVAALADAETGIVAIDESIRDFYQTGYLHNHVRMYIAGIACNIGKAHWHRPSQWMYAHLLDGDLASNTCSWQWVAGAFSSKKYFANQENINRYTHSHQQQTFLDVPTEMIAHQDVPSQLKETRDWKLVTNLPTPGALKIDITKPTLIYNSYNLDPLWRKDDNVNRVLLLEPSHFERFPVSENVLQFILALSRNISGLQVLTGEVKDLIALYNNSVDPDRMFISREHPAFRHYRGVKDTRDWIYPAVTGYFPSFFSYWKQCCRQHETPVS